MSNGSITPDDDEQGQSWGGVADVWSLVQLSLRRGINFWNENNEAFCVACSGEGDQLYLATGNIDSKVGQLFKLFERLSVYPITLAWEIRVRFTPFCSDKKAAPQDANDEDLQSSSDDDYHFDDADGISPKRNWSSSTLRMSLSAVAVAVGWLDVFCNWKEQRWSSRTRKTCSSTPSSASITSLLIQQIGSRFRSE